MNTVFILSGFLTVLIILRLAWLSDRYVEAKQREAWERAVSLVAEVYELSEGRRCRMGMAHGATDVGRLVVEHTKVHLTIPDLSAVVVISPRPVPGSTRGTTGERPFDERMFISETGALGLLDHPMRRWFCKVAATKELPTVKDGRVSLTFDGFPKERRLISLVHRVMDLGKELAGRLAHSEPERLADMLRHDPVRLVREKAVKVLLETWPRDPLATTAAEFAMGSHSMELKILAAGHLQTAQARELLIQAALAGDTAPDLAAAALRAMARDPEAAAFAPNVVARFGRLNGVRLVAALEFLFAAGSLPSPQALEHRSRSVGPDARLAIVAAANRHGASGRPLLLKLALDPSEDVAINALRTLALAGDLSMIEGLIAIEATDAPRAVRAVARQTIDAIQQREGVGAVGSLALAEVDAAVGGLSAYRGETGAVQIAD